MRIMNGYFNNDLSTGQSTCCTPRGTSLVDYLVCDFNFFNHINDFKVFPLSVDSDHKPLYFQINLKNALPETQPVETVNRSTNSYFRYIYDESKSVHFLSSLENEHCLKFLDDFTDSVLNNESVNDAVDCIYKFIEGAVSKIYTKKYQKSVKNTFPNNPWFDTECKELKRALNDYSKLHNLNIEYYRMYYFNKKKTYKSLIQKKKREHLSKTRSDLENFHSKNQNDYWKLWDKLKKANKPRNRSVKLNLQSFESYFSSIRSPSNSMISNFDLNSIEIAKSYIANHNMEENGSLYLTDPPITQAEIFQQIKNLKLNKAPGIDGIGNEFYKVASDKFLIPFTVLFNYIWDSGVFPDKWSEGVIQPLHKKGSTDIADNYRKLTLMACMGKVFESILNNRLIIQSELLNVNDPNQFGFCKNRRTTDNVFIIDTLISYQKLKKRKLYVTFIDFTKAFDFINRDLLYFKLLKSGFGVKLVKIIMSLFSKASARVRWEGQLGEKIDSTHGVLQGGIISPKLFNFFLSDLKEYLDQSLGISIDGNTYTHLVYADDLVLLSESSTGMQTLLNEMARYCKKWHLIINTSKTKVMIFNNKKKTIAIDNFKLENEKLEIVDNYKYLGHVLCNTRNIHTQMHQNLAIQAQRALHLLNDNIKSTVGYMAPKLALRMFDTHVLPILEYNCEVWFSKKQISEIEKIQLKFLKSMLGVRNQTTTVGLLADTGRYPLLVRQHLSAVKYLLRLESDNCPPLVRSSYAIQKMLHARGSQCWYSRLLGVFEDNAITDLDNLRLIPIKLYSKAQEIMFAAINDINKNPKLRTYKTFKKDMRIEPYLNLGIQKSYYCNIARFRLSSHNLNIELGRHKRPFVPSEERFCDKCDLQLVEDEIHCLMVCPKWNDIRTPLMQIVFRHIENYALLSVERQFQEILSDKSLEVNTALGRFLKTALKLAE